MWLKSLFTPAPATQPPVPPPPPPVIVPPPVVVKPPPIQQAPGYVKGMDVSGWQGQVDFAKAKANGYLFAFIKATQGTSIKDIWFVNHWAESKAAGVLRGAYHYFEPGVDGVAQADWFTSVVGPHESGDLPCVLDWESPSKGPTISDLTNALAFLRRVETLHGKAPIIYTSPSFMDVLKQVSGGNADFQALVQYPLWIAHWGVVAPKVPPPWLYYSFWQTADHGLGQPGDEDRFNGSMEQLMKFT